MLNFYKMLEYSHKLSDELIKIRRIIHQNPELGLECYETAKIIEDNLGKMDLQIRTNIVKSGIEAVLPGRNKSPVIAIRADMDALPIQEENEIEFKSSKMNKMHACGHDGHVSMVLGAAKILNHFKNEIPGTIKLIFQPGEEYPGAAKGMIEEGVLSNPDVDALISGHIFPGIESGIIGIREGAVTAQNDEFTITLNGRGGHGAHPNETEDTIVVASLLILKLQTIISRIVNPVDPIAINIGEFKGGSGHNVIPKEVKLKGTIRTINKDSREKAINRIDKFLKGLSMSYDISYDIDLVHGEPVLFNDKRLIQFCRNQLTKVLGVDKLKDIEKPSLGSEDCAYFSTHVPTVYYRFGSYNKKEGYVNSLHTSKFNFDDNLLSYFSSIIAYTAYILIKHLNNEEV